MFSGSLGPRAKPALPSLSNMLKQLVCLQMGNSWEASLDGELVFPSISSKQTGKSTFWPEAPIYRMRHSSSQFNVC